jgi:hypothetical protein
MASLWFDLVRQDCSARRTPAKSKGTNFLLTKKLVAAPPEGRTSDWNKRPQDAKPKKHRL